MAYLVLARSHHERHFTPQKNIAFEAFAIFATMFDPFATLVLEESLNQSATLQVANQIDKYTQALLGLEL